MEQAFVHEFVRGLEPFEKKLDETYEGDHSRPIILAPMPVDLPADAAERAVGAPLGSATSTIGDTKPVVLKSIRPPKFSVQYDVPVTDSIYAVKERLVTDPSGPLKDYDVANVHLLLKAKAVADTRQLRELPSAEFTVMTTSNNTSDSGPSVPVPATLYWGDYADFVPAPSSKAVEVSQPSKPGLTPEFWKEVERLASKYVDNATELVAQFKTAQSTLSGPEAPDLD